MGDFEFGFRDRPWQFGQRASEAFLQLHESLAGFVESFGGCGQGEVGGDDQQDLFAHMVESEHFIEEEKAGVGDVQFILGCGGKPLDLADNVVAQEAYGAGSERGQARDARRYMAAQGFAQDSEDVAFGLDRLFAFGDGDGASAGDDALVGIEPDEGVAADLLAILNALEEETFGGFPSGPEEGGHRSFEVRSQGAVDRDEGVLLGEREEVFAAWLDLIGEGHGRVKCKREHS